MAFGETKSEHLMGIGVLSLMLVSQLSHIMEYTIMGIAVWGHVGGALGGILLSVALYNHRADGAS